MYRWLEACVRGFKEESSDMLLFDLKIDMTKIFCGDVYDNVYLMHTIVYDDVYRLHVDMPTRECCHGAEMQGVGKMYKIAVLLLAAQNSFYYHRSSISLHVDKGADVCGL